MDVRSLEQTLAYQHPGVTEKLQSVYGVSADEAEDLFLEAKRWLWLCAKSNRDRDAGLDAPEELAITPSLTMMDEAWHTFILFTPDYLGFCRDYLGEYIHHLPNAGQHTEEEQDITPMLRAMMGYVYDQLGRDTLIKWYSEYHDKYAGLVVRFVPTRPNPDVDSTQAEQAMEGP